MGRELDAADHGAEDAADGRAEQGQDHDNDDGDEHEDQGLFNKTLSLFFRCEKHGEISLMRAVRINDQRTNHPSNSILTENQQSASVLRLENWRAAVVFRTLVGPPIGDPGRWADC